MKKIWIILLIVGILIFLIPILNGIYDSIIGFSGLCFFQCKNYYGFQALIEITKIALS